MQAAILLLIVVANSFHFVHGQEFATRGDFTVVSGAALSVATAGAAATFTISAKDDSGNARTSGGDNFAVALDGVEPAVLSVVDNLNGVHAVSYTTMSSGVKQIAVSLAKAGGLFAQYFENVWFFYTPVLERVDPQIDFDWGSGGITPSAMDYVSVRWTGRVRVTMTEMYTFYADADDGIRLWVNGVQLIDRWDGGANMTAAKVALTAGRFNSIKVEYKDATGPARISLYWSSPSTSKEIIPASQLFYEVPCKSSPWPVVVVPSAACASASVARGAGLVPSATAGVFASFDIESRDQFSNVRETGGEIVAAHVFPQLKTVRCVQSDVADNRDGTYSAIFRPITSGSSALAVQYLTVGGLFATMYTDVAFAQPVTTVQVASVDYTKPASTSQYISAGDPSNDALFSIRYAGFFRASASGTHTFSVVLAYQSENFVLYLDNLLAIDASSGVISAPTTATISLVALQYYSVQLNYISSSAAATARKVQLSVITPTPETVTPVPSTHLHAGFHVAGSPFAIDVAPARICAALSVVSDATGDALSIATAGLTAVFSITAKDIYGNLRSSVSNSTDSFRISLSGVSGASGAAVGNPDGSYRAIYSVTKAGTYDLSIVFGSAPIGQSPYKIWAQPAGRLLKNSPVRGAGLTLLTAGVQAAVTITIRDVFSNGQPHAGVSNKIKIQLADATNMAVTYCNAAGCPSFASGSLVATPVSLDNPLYVASFTVTKAGKFSLSIYGSDAFDTHVMGSPFQLTVLPAVFNDAVISDFQPTTSIAGRLSYFHARTFDAFGNICYNCTQVLSVFTRLAAGVRDTLGSAAMVEPSRYSASYTATKCETNSLHVVFGTSSGITAAYYQSNNWATNTLLSGTPTLVPDIDFSLAASTPYKGLSGGAFSARFTGLFRATASGIATFKIAHKSTSDSYKLTFRNNVLATMPSAISAATIEYTTLIQQNQLYDILFEYVAGTYSDPHGISFSVNMGFGDAPVTSQHLFASRAASLSPLSFTAAPGTVCAALCTRQAAGRSLSIVTAGETASFTIQSRDLFNNKRTVNVDDGFQYAVVSGGRVPPAVATSSSLRIQATAVEGGTELFVGSVQPTFEGGYRVTYSATLSGLYTLSGRVKQPGGLYGLYYETDNLQDNSVTPSNSVASQPTFQRLDSEINFRWGLGRPVDPVDPYYTPFSSKSIGPDFFSVRWHGGVLAPRSEVFTFSAEADDGVRLYIDNLLIINQWNFKSGVVDGTISLISGTMYPIKLEYKESNNNATIVLMWSSRSMARSVIPSSSLYYTITSGPISSEILYVPPSTACHTFSSIYGPGLTVATAGVAAYFTIQSMDAYGNHRVLMDAPYFYTRLFPVTANSARPYKSQFNGLASASGITASYDRISNPLFIGGFTATYYTSDFPNGAAVSCEHAANGCGAVDVSSSVTYVSTNFVINGLGSFAGSNSNSLIVRWSGFFQPTTSGQYRFYIAKTSGSAGFSISNSGVGMAALASFSGVTTATPSASVNLMANAFYEVLVQFSATSGISQCALQYTIEPSGQSTSYSSSFPLIPTTNMFPLAGRYRVKYTAPTVKGDYSPEVSLAIPGGLDATFYDDMSLTSPRSTVLHTLVDFTSTSFASNVQRVSSLGLADVGYGAGVNVSDFSSFSVRWQGFFKATRSETTFSVSIREADERVRLWVDNLLLINSWEYALPAVSFSATFGATFVDQGGLRVSDFNSLFDIKLEYMQFAGESGISVPLFTAADNPPNIFRKRDITIPPPLSVHPAATCAAKSIVRGTALTRATAGVPATFTVLSLDIYHNDRDVDGDVYVSRLYPVVCEFTSACPSVYGSVTSLGDSTYVVSYMGTKKGSYDLVTSLAIPSTLTATYYETNYAGSRTTVYKSYSALVLMPTSSGGVRYAGFIQPPVAGSVTFSVSTSSGGDISIWVFDTRLSATASATFTSSATSGSAIISFPNANALYDVRVDLSSSNTDLSLLWIYSGLPVATIPSNRVFARTDVPNKALGVPTGSFSEASLMLVAGGTCAAQSLSKGSGLTAATAGAPASFTLTSRDAYANDRGLDESSMVIRFSGPSRLTAAANGDSRALSAVHALNAGSYASVVGPGRYTASYTLTVSGVYNVDVLVAGTGGLKSEYFCNSWLSGTPCLVSTDATVDFNWGLNAVAPALTNLSLGSNFMSVRWSGYFMWETSETVTFYTQTDEGTRLYIDNVVVIEAWDSIGSNFSATWSGSGVGGLYPIVMEYRESTDVAYCRLMYSTASAIQQPIPSSLLFPYANHVFGSPFSMYVREVSTCATTSTASLSPTPSIYTVGTFSAISITTRDQYSNTRTEWDVSSPSVYVRTCAVDFSDYCKRLPVTRSTPGSWSASFSATRATATNIIASLVHTGGTFRGMHATYYNSEVIGTNPFKNGVVAISSSTLSSDTKAEAWGTSANPLPFSIRWAGVFVAATIGLYTFSASVAASDGALMYVNNVKIADGWATSSSAQSLAGTIFLDAGVNAFYDIVLHYRRSVNNAGQVTNFQFQSGGNAAAAHTAFVMQPLRIPPLPSLLQYSAGPSVIQKCDFNGASLSISTAGNTAHFSVTTRDFFGNLRSSGGDAFYLLVSKADGTAASAKLSDSGNGIYIGSYAAEVEGAYVISLALGSAATAFHMTVFPATVCASKCITTSSSLSVATAGYAGSFTVTMRDAFSNYRTSFTDNLIAKMNGPRNEMKNLRVTYSNNAFAHPYVPTYQASYRTTASGSFSIDVHVATSTGLNASFFIDPDLTQLVWSRIDSTVAADWGLMSPDPKVSAVDMFSVQWSGFVKPDYGGEYTFVTTIADTSDRLRLWIDDQYIINLWNTAPSAESNAATIKLSSNTLYDIKLQYRDTSGSAAVTLTWVRNGAAQQIPTERLISATARVAGSPFSATVFPSMTCGTLSTASGPGLSLATAGVPASFTITAFDHLGNRVSHSSDIFTVRARNPASSIADRVGTITSLGSGRYAGVYTPTLKRNEVTQWHDVPISLGISGGPLIATYYKYSDGAIISTGSTFLTASATPAGVSVSYNAKYSGFIQPPTSTWTFAVLTSAAGLSVKIDGKQHLTGAGATVIVGAANALYDIDISVTNVASGSAAIAITLAGTQQSLEEASGRVFQRHDLTFQTFDAAGLQATFYSDTDSDSDFFDNPQRLATMTSIDWSYAANTPKPHSSAPSAGAYGVRWKGFFRPTMSDVYTFYFQKSAGETSVTLSLDNSAAVSISNAATESSATVFIPAPHQLYEITVYLVSSNSGSALFRLLWLNEGNTYANYDRPAARPSISVKTVVGTDSLFRIRTLSQISRNDQSHYYDSGALPECGSASNGNVLRWYQCRGLGLRFNNPPKVEVRTSLVCGSQSALTAAFVAVRTVGQLYSFDILTKDAYGNIMDGRNAAVVMTGTQQSGSSAGKFYGYALPTLSSTTPSDPGGVYTVTYMASTVAGSYVVNVGVADSAGNGLRGVYYLGGSLGGHVALNQVDSLLNFSWGASVPLAQLSSSVPWSARWTGFIRLTDSASDAFTFYLRTGAGGGRVYVANSLVIDSTSSVVGGEVSGTTSLQNNGVYDIVVEYIASATPTLIQLSYASPSNPKQICPSSSLYPFIGTLSNGAQTLTVMHGTVCGGLSLKSNEKLSIVTAGIPASFKLTSVDQYGNFRTDQSNVADCNAAVPSCVFSATVIPAKPSLNPPVRSAQGSITTHNVNNVFNVQYTVTAAGLYSVTAFASPSSGGLFATYYDDLLLAAPRAAQLQSDPGWNVANTEVPTVSGAPLVPDGLFSVRLGGALKPTTQGDHTFAATHSEMLTVYVDGVLVIDRSTYSGAASSFSGVINLPVANAFYDVTILYTSDAMSGSRLSDLSINGVSFASLTSNLFASALVGTASGIIVHPNVPCGTRSNINGYGLTVLTSGSSVFLTITVRDEYYNLRTRPGDNVVVRAFALPGSSVTPTPNFFDGADVYTGNTCAGCPTVPVAAAVTDFSDARCKVSLLLTVAGKYKASAALALRGGLIATFYAVDNSFSFNVGKSGAAMFSSLDYSSASAVSGRWHGFIQPSLAGLYTFFVKPVSSSNEFMKLWISNTLVVDRTTTIPQAGFSATYSFAAANALYDIFVAYSTSSGGFSVFWERMGSASAADDVQRQSIPTTRLYTRDEVSGANWLTVAAATVFHAAACGSKAVVTNLAVTHTAGAATSFTISSRDAYSTPRTMGSDFMFNAVTTHSTGSPNIYSTVVYAGGAGSAYSVATPALTVSGMYYTHVRGGGEHVLGSPFTITLVPAQECSSTSLSFGAGLTVTTVNVASSFYVQTRDAWGNIRTLPNVLSTTIFVGRAFTSAIGSSPETTNISPYTAASSTNAVEAYWRLPSWYVGSYQFTAAPASGHFGYFRGVSLAALGGFLVTYYNVATLNALVSSGTPLKTAVDRFSSSNTATVTNAFAARWSGFIRSTSSGQVSWNAFTQSSTVKGKIWVNGGAAAYGSPAGDTAVSAVFTTVINTLYHVQIEYRSTSSVPAALDTFGSAVGTSNMYADFAFKTAPAQLAVY